MASIHFFSYSTKSFKLKAGLKYTGVKLYYITDHRVRIVLEIKLRTGPSTVLVNRHVK